jgi:hypothetical protein
MITYCTYVMAASSLLMIVLPNPMIAAAKTINEKVNGSGLGSCWF